MEICPYSMLIGCIVTSFVFIVVWGSMAYGKHLGRSEKKIPARQHPQ